MQRKREIAGVRQDSDVECTQAQAGTDLLG